MTDDNTRLRAHGSAWQLLLQRQVAGGGSRGERTAWQIADALSALGMQPGQVERIERSVARALQSRARDGTQAPPAAVRVWASGLPYSGGAGAWQQGKGAGYFLLETEEAVPPAGQDGSRLVIDLYLYQEAADPM